MKDKRPAVPERMRRERAQEAALAAAFLANERAGTLLFRPARTPALGGLWTREALDLVPGTMSVAWPAGSLEESVQRLASGGSPLALRDAACAALRERGDAAMDAPMRAVALLGEARRERPDLWRAMMNDIRAALAAQKRERS